VRPLSFLLSCFVVVLAAVAACSETDGRPTGAAPSSSKTTVVRAVDGDTIRVEVGGKERSVRLIGIDTPETHKPGVGVECGGPEAAASMAELAPAGAVARLTYDSSQDRVDRYGRLLAYVSVRGRSLQLEQLYAGNAMVYVYGGHPFKRVDAFRRAEGVARDARRGVWGHCSGNFHSGQ
jgi:micrococcal nuclease